MKSTMPKKTNNCGINNLIMSKKMVKATEIISNNEYSLENLVTLPLEDQAIMCFGVARELFRQNKGMLASQFMAKALSINPDLLRLTINNDD